MANGRLTPPLKLIEADREGLLNTDFQFRLENKVKHENADVHIPEKLNT
jgi:hypothetical protein